MAKNKNLLICLFCTLGINCFAQQKPVRDAIVKTYESQIGVRELTGRNDGIEVEKYLSYVWLKKGQPWCAAFVSWTFGLNNIKKARSGGCVALMDQGRLVYKGGKVLSNRPPPQRADVFFIWYENKKRVAHTGFVHQWGDMVQTVEGNTNQAGSREGDGVYRKWRQRIQIYAVCNYID